MGDDGGMHVVIRPQVAVGEGASHVPWGWGGIGSACLLLHVAAQHSSARLSAFAGRYGPEPAKVCLVVVRVCVGGGGIAKLVAALSLVTSVEQRRFKVMGR